MGVELIFVGVAPFFLTMMSRVFSSVSVPSPTIIAATSFAVGVLYLREYLLRRVTKRSDKGAAGWVDRCRRAFSYSCAYGLMSCNIVCNW